MNKFKVGDHVRIIRDNNLPHASKNYVSTIGHTGIIKAIYSGKSPDTRLYSANPKNETEYEISYDNQFVHCAVVGRVCFEDDLELLHTKKDPYKAYDDAMKGL